MLEELLLEITQSDFVYAILGGLLGGGGEKSRTEQHELLTPQQRAIYEGLLALLSRNTNFGPTQFESSSLEGLEATINQINDRRAGGGTASTRPAARAQPRPQAATSQAIPAEGPLRGVTGTAARNPAVNTITELLQLLAEEQPPPPAPKGPKLRSVGPFGSYGV